MSRKKKVILLILSSLVIVIFLYHYGFFSRYNYLTAKVDIQKGNVQLILVDADADGFFREEYLARRYNIKMDLLDKVFLINNITNKGVAIYNQQMEKQIKMNLGEKKYRKYQHDLDSLYKEFAKPLSPIEIHRNQ
ncbi:MAG: hypothetical protein ACM3PR_01370 [Bacteroidales bacterium]